MPKIGRNDPCPCGSGKKYKQCHLVIEEAAAAEQLRLRRSVDTLLPKIIGAAQAQLGAIPAAFERFWDGKYTPAQLEELDDLEGRGGERFLTWFAFDYPLDDGRTLVEQLAAGDAEPSDSAEAQADNQDAAPDITDSEARLLRDWANVRLRPYVAQSVRKGQGMQVSDLLDERTYDVDDHAASRRVEPGEVLVAHLVPAGTRHYVAGAAAHLTEDTRAKLHEFAELHLEALKREQPDATWNDMIRAHSETLNHFVMQLPVEEPNPTLLDNIVTQTRISLKLAGESLGIGRKDEE
jgi:SEC-C motif-containing protein